MLNIRPLASPSNSRSLASFGGIQHFPDSAGPFTPRGNFSRFCAPSSKALFRMEPEDTHTRRLAELLLTGNPDAARRLYECYRSPVHAYCSRMLGDPDEADDATQETLMLALRDGAGLRSPDRLRHWIFGIARHRILMALRARKNGYREPLSDDLWHEETPHSIAESNDARSHVRRAVDALAPPFRELVILRDYNQFSYAEIAALTGLAESAVRSRLHRARQALIRKLKPIFAREDDRELR